MKNCTYTLINYFNKKVKTTHVGIEIIVNEKSQENSSSSISTATLTSITIEYPTNFYVDISYCFDQKVSDELKYKLLTNG